MQRVWLEATKLGLSFQPMTGITFLVQKVLDRDNKDILPAHVNAYERLIAGFGLRNETIVVLFRIGHSDPHSTHSLRLPIDNIVKTD